MTSCKEVYCVAKCTMDHDMDGDEIITRVYVDNVFGTEEEAEMYIESAKDEDDRSKSTESALRRWESKWNVENRPPTKPKLEPLVNLYHSAFSDPEEMERVRKESFGVHERNTATTKQYNEEKELYDAKREKDRSELLRSINHEDYKARPYGDYGDYRYQVHRALFYLNEGKR